MAAGPDIILGVARAADAVKHREAVSRLERMSGQTIGAADAGARSVIVEISDTGPGIPGHLRDAVFAPFFTTQSEGKGSGLGLYIVRMICEESGARIELSEAPRGGAQFRVIWPAAGDESNR